MTIEEAKKHVQNLSSKAASVDKSEDALRFSQAACNVANAFSVMFNVDKYRVVPN